MIMTILGATLHSIAQLSGRSSSRKLESTLAQTRTLIIDEVSMLGLATLAKLSNRLSTAKHKPDIAFGEIDMIFVGKYKHLSFPNSQESNIHHCIQQSTNKIQ